VRWSKVLASRGQASPVTSYRRGQATEPRTYERQMNQLRGAAPCGKQWVLALLYCSTSLSDSEVLRDCRQRLREVSPRQTMVRMWNRVAWSTPPSSPLGAGSNVKFSVGNELPSLPLSSSQGTMGPTRLEQLSEGH